MVAEVSLLPHDMPHALTNSTSKLFMTFLLTPSFFFASHLPPQNVCAAERGPNNHRRAPMGEPLPVCMIKISLATR
ncbi:uncharacterized protein ASPGLDRAFT_1045228 [Aspergillus glaucus CBS 516.65]|uniref:Uncharacterized protein n=1 Tax=Aspergillus glaucus CBS 516.65 TaxID=1160497 RepID=A0A1L9V610_ASPGL|nr:hypothetical protein ASPGLDRAFT_1045228 [Aspergillus glaucus CBS 516.65]OJJ79365.1 hypothetical protein ASPGLDRAFT_1045228 [Aspergillus glaucus CBS 516.65]